MCRNMETTPETREPYKASVSIRLTIPTLTAVDILSNKRKVTRSDIIEEAVENFLQEQKVAEEAKRQ